MWGQTVRNHLKRQQDPSGLVRMNDDAVMKLRSTGALSKRRGILAAIDTHDIMYHGDPDAKGVTGTRSPGEAHTGHTSLVA